MTRTGPLPFVFVNMAMTADGKIASANRRISILLMKEAPPVPQGIKP